MKAKVISILSRILFDEQGQGMTEYALILALIAIAAITVLGLMGDQITARFQEVVNTLTPAP